MAATVYYSAAHPVGSSASGTSDSQNITPPSGHSNTALIVFVHFHVDPGSISGTWNGTALEAHGTQAGGYENATNGFVLTFKLANPTSDGSAHALAFSWTNTARCQWIAEFTDGTDQTTPFDAVDDATGLDGTQATNTVTSATGDIALGAMYIDVGTDPTVVVNNGAQSQLAEVWSGAGGVGMHTSSIDGAASVGFDVSWTGAQDWYYRCVNVNAVAAAGGVTPRSITSIGPGGLIGAMRGLIG